MQPPLCAGLCTGRDKPRLVSYLANTKNNFAVNIPLFSKYTADHIDIVIKENVPIVFTSAGNPKIWTKKLKSHDIIVVHVISNLKFAFKALDAGVDALVCEGFEAGGHNGRDETTTFCLGNVAWKLSLGNLALEFYLMKISLGDLA